MPEETPEVLEIHGFGPYPVTEISQYIHKMKDGTQIAMKLWLPWLPENDPAFVGPEFKNFMTVIQTGSPDLDDPEVEFPTILEYLPYGKDTPMTVMRDRSRHPFFCSYGYICVRPDMRGTCESQGEIRDEYYQHEQQDIVELINWLGKQRFSNGAVGLYGKSWGGFNGLQVGYEQPVRLKAVISAYSTDDRYTDDVHYCEGDVMYGSHMLSWGVHMLAINARPPHPRYFETEKEWARVYTDRLKETAGSWTNNWLTRQNRTEKYSSRYWKHGSINVNYNRIRCPVLIIGGLCDGYKNPAFRMSAKLNGNPKSKGIIGPWAHVWPDNGKPGPNIDFLGTCLKWWEYHLKADYEDYEAESTDEWPKLQVFLQDSSEPGNQKLFPGKWIGLPDWTERLEKYEEWTLESGRKDPNIKVLHLYGKGRLVNEYDKHEERHEIELYPHPIQGDKGGEWFCWTENSLPLDQTIPNDHCHCWETPSLEEDLIICGMIKAYIKIKVPKIDKDSDSDSDSGGRKVGFAIPEDDTPQETFIIAARLCDERLDGTSTRISRGVKNLGSLKRSTFEMVEVVFTAASYVIPKGHRLNLVLTPTYFPLFFATPNNQGVTIDPDGSYLVFQTLSKEDLKNTVSFDAPKPLLELPREELAPPSMTVLNFKQDASDDLWKTEAIEDEGTVLLKDLRAKWSQVNIDRGIIDEDAVKGVVESERKITAEFLDHEIDVDVHAEGSLKLENGEFVLNESLEVKINSNQVFDNTFEHKIPSEIIRC